MRGRCSGRRSAGLTVSVLLAAALLVPAGARAAPVREARADAVAPAASPVADAAIVNGAPADISAYPWLGAILYDGNSPLGAAAPEQVRQYCGGTLVAPAIVLTAAHCFTDLKTGEQLSPAGFHVVFGRSRLDTAGGVSVDVREIIRDPEFDVGRFTHDAALLVLSRPVDIRPGALAGLATQLREGRKATIVGWGLTDEDDRLASAQLMSARVPVWSNRRCYSAYPLRHEPSLQLCAAPRRGGVDTCRGDSGGPLIVRQGGRPVILGVVSSGHGCARKGYPGIYTWVGSPFLRPWVERTIAARTTGDPDRAAPVLTDLAARAARVTYTVSEQSLLVVAVQRRRGGRSWRTLDTALMQDAAAGPNSFTRPTRLRGRRLARGDYRLRATATDAAGNRSTAALTRFSIG